MSFIIQPVELTVQNLPAHLLANTAAPYYAGTSYTWTITDFDSYVVYTLTTTNGSVSLAGSTITYTPASSGVGGFTINNRGVSLTITLVTDWLASLYDVVTNSGRGIAVDSSGNVYAIAQSDGDFGGRYAAYFAKYDSQGNLQWQRALGTNSAGRFVYGQAIKTNTAGDIYFAANANPVGTDTFIIGKYNSSGTIQFQRYLSAFPREVFNIALDSSDNIYAAAKYTTGGQDVIQLHKFNNLGVNQWSADLQGVANSQGRAVAVAPNGDIFLGGYTPVGGISRAVIAKYDASGNIQWQRVLYSGSGDACYAMAVDASSNVYITGYTQNSDILIAKYNSSGVIQWQRKLAGGSSQGLSIVVDSSSNVYIAGYSSQAGTNDYQLAKYDSAGTIQWQRRLTNTTGTDIAYGIAINTNGNIIVNGYLTASATSQDIFIASLPSDGSKTGTYTLTNIYGNQTITYAVSSLTSSTTTNTDAAGSLTASLGNSTTAASSETTVTGSLNATRTVM